MGRFDDIAWDLLRKILSKPISDTVGAHPLSIGCKVQLLGLAAIEYNGAFGTVISLLNSRCGVRVDCRSRPIFVKRANLVLVFDSEPVAQSRFSTFADGASACARLRTRSSVGPSILENTFEASCGASSLDVGGPALSEVLASGHNMSAGPRSANDLNAAVLRGA